MRRKIKVMNNKNKIKMIILMKRISNNKKNSFMISVCRIYKINSFRKKIFTNLQKLQTIQNYSKC